MKDKHDWVSNQVIDQTSAMFYVPASKSPSDQSGEVIDTAKLVQKKLGQDEVCLQVRKVW